jgi:hypothetical protein
MNDSNRYPVMCTSCKRFIPRAQAKRVSFEWTCPECVEDIDQGAIVGWPAALATLVILGIIGWIVMDLLRRQS